ALVYVTPGPIVCANKTYLGVGAMILNPGRSAAALISGNMLNAPLNGGYGASPSPLDVSFYTPAKTSNYSLTLNGDTPSFDLKISKSVDYGTNNIALSSAYILSLSNGTTVQSATQQNAVTLGSDALKVTSSNTGAVKIGDITQGVGNLGWLGATSSFADSKSQISKMVADPVNAITGGFYLNETDLLIPGPIPIQLTRNYDSLNMASNEFGAGWKIGCFSYLSVATDSSVIYAAEMDGSVICYRQQSGSTTRWTPLAADNPNLSNQQGDAVGSVCNLFNNRIDKTTSGTATTYTLTGANGSTRTFVVAAYPTPGPKGLTRQRPYLQKWQDPQGNFLSFTFGSDPLLPDYGFLNRISSSNGNFLQLGYDIYGHVISASAADGRRVLYSYDSYGDLVGVTRPDASNIRYDYSHQPNTGAVSTGFYSEHLLTRETKPAGRILENVYDAQRRVTKQKATVGQNSALTTNATFQYNNTKNADGTLTGYTLVADALTQVTRYDYAGSQITKVTDPLNQTVQTVWYAPGDTSAGAYQRSLKQRIDKRGLSVSYKYDARGNLIETATTGNLTGSGNSTAVQSIAYNALNLPVQINEPNGNFQKLLYSSSISPYLLTSLQKYAPGGLISQTDYTYCNVGGSSTPPFANGLLQQVTQAAG
ncbi:MAG: RHS repeat protein, partial [Verrucomicrobia bacterium]|nr:RHS repeat protein [Verrucomicrobiota bacterium]